MQQRYLVPRIHHLSIVVLSYGMIDLTVRQFIVLIVGGLIAVNLWPSLSFFSLALALPILLFGWVRVAGRDLEIWIFLALRYWLLEPRLYTWPARSTPAPTRTRKKR